MLDPGEQSGIKSDLIFVSGKFRGYLYLDGLQGITST
jgi:hypothetical protein